MERDPNQHLEDLYFKWRNCRKCENACKDQTPNVCDGRTHIVFGTGNPSADILVIGIAPGEAEDKSGIPFSAETGVVRDEFLRDAGLARAEIYSHNLIACRPYVEVTDQWRGGIKRENRDPNAEERRNCRALLNEIIYTVDPLVIVGMGKPVVAELTGLRSITMTKMVGEVMQCTIPGRTGDPIPYTFIPMFNPAFLSRLPDRSEGSHWWKTRIAWQRLTYITDHLRKAYYGEKPPTRPFKKEDVFTAEMK